MPSGQLCSPTVLPSARAKRASSSSRPHLCCVRCRARPSFRLRLPTVLSSARAKGGPAALADLSSLTCDAALYYLVGYGHLQCGHLRARTRTAAIAGRSSLTCDAVLCHRAGCGRLPGGHKRVRRNQQHLQASRLVRAMRSHAIIGGDKRQRRQQALLLLRVIPRHAREPDVVSYSAASGACRSVSSTSRPYIACERSSALPSGRLCSPTVLLAHGGADFEEKCCLTSALETPP